MVDIKCPMCSKINQEDAEECIFCGARLTENIGDDPITASGDPGGDILATLRAMGGVNPEDDSPDVAGDFLSEERDSGEDIPDWLMRIRNISEQEDEPQKDEWITSEDDEAPDWITALTSEPEKEDVVGKGPAEEEPIGEITDHIETGVQAAEEKPGVADGEGELPDWLREIDSAQTESQKLRQEITGEPDKVEAVGQEDLSGIIDGDIPDWLRGEAPQKESFDDVGEAPFESPEEILEDEDMVARLQSLDLSAEAETSEEGDVEESAVETIFGEVQTVKSDSQQQDSALESLEFADDDELKDWYASLQAGIGDDDEEENLITRDESTSGVIELPASDTLPTLSDELPLELQENEAEFASVDRMIRESSDISDNNEEISSEVSSPIEEPSERSDIKMDMQDETAGQEQAPDWMRLRDEQISSEIKNEADALPDWMQEPSSPPTSEAIPAASTDESTFVPDKEGELPGWLFGEEETADVDNNVLSSGDIDLDDWKPVDDEAEGPESFETEDLSEWLGDLTPEKITDVFDTKKQKQSASDSQSETPPFVGQDIGAWMKEEEGTIPEAEGKSEAEDANENVILPSEEVLPDWLDDGPGAEKQKSARRETAPQESGEIQQVDLPDWLEAMRPIDSVLPEQVVPIDDKKVEQSGPLAGLRAVLPAAPSAAHYRKPPIYSVKLQVSEKQRAHAAMLENLLEENKRTAGVRPKKTRTPHRLIRAIIGLFLVVAVLLPLLGIPEVSLIPPTSSVVPFYDQIEAVPAGSPVLLAVDYAPGFAGEMRFAGTGVMQRLMTRELRIATISTLPAGPVLAEGLKMAAIARDSNLEDKYEDRDWFINMGYLPGEVVSLQEFAQNPKQAVQFGLSTGLENRPVWDSSVLLKINDLNDFAMIVLFTDTIESGRSWIEQVQPVLQDVPLLVVSSAQAAPMLQPYLQSGQVQALLSGLGDGLAYEENLKLPDEDRRTFWLANQFGLAAGILIILVGALIEGISSLVGRNRSDEA